MNIYLDSTNSFIEPEMKCICCTSKNITSTSYQSFFNLPILKCNDCLLYSVWDKDSTLDLQKYYDETYWEIFRNIENKANVNQKTDNAYRVKKLPKLFQKCIDYIGVRKSFSYSQLKYLLPYLSHKKTLFELGSGEGFILEFFEKKGFDVFGFEPSKINLKLINKKLKQGICKTGSSEEISKIEKKFDIIILSHVLEHVIDCRKVLINLKKILSENGILFIDVPNCGNIESLEQSINTQPHIFHFTKKSLEMLASSVGFKVVRSDFYYGKVTSLLEHFEYLLYWIFKKDYFIPSNENDGNYFRLILQNQ